MNGRMQGMERDVVLASADAALRHRLRESLTGLRWRVHEAAGGAEALTLLEHQGTGALLMDGWLPDLEAVELAGHIAMLYPSVDVLSVDGGSLTTARSAHRNELLHALREAHGPVSDTAAWNTAPREVPRFAASSRAGGGWDEAGAGRVAASVLDREPSPVEVRAIVRQADACIDYKASPAGNPQRAITATKIPSAIPGLVGESEPMAELTRMIRLVAPRNSTVLIEGETGTGKEVVAAAIHRLSARAAKPMVVLNCAAIPDSLLEAELFGHTRGAFTGAVQARVGRIEAAHGGTLFLDEIGELPLAVQAKLLRFLECGELQRVGDNDVVRVDVRVIAATHRDLEQRVVDGEFRLDLYHRLAVFPLEVPALRERIEDLPALAEHLLARLGAEAPRKRITEGALGALQQHRWQGNVRELAHVLERAVILASDSPDIEAEHIRVRRRG